MLTHAWNYLMGVRKMARSYGISLDKAREIDERLSAEYEVLVGWRTALVERVLGKWEKLPGRRRKVCTEEGTRFLANPFGWQKFWLGVEGSQANEVVAFLPQSTGASMWARCAVQLEERYPIMTGTYDSFVLVVPDARSDINEAAAFMAEVMEQEWACMNGTTYPTELQVGLNWGEYNERENPRGLRLV